ncbi:hypothetical protein FRC06_000945 [Ceratobasidium sp. 370]|nr:hypothetical protein FRC06_000945 [Ceratobasidium sp. 370]
MVNGSGAREARLALGSRKVSAGRSKFGLAQAKAGFARHLRGVVQDNAGQFAAPTTGDDFIGALIEDNQDLWNNLLNHPFGTKMGNGSATLDAFKEYMIQDFLYLRSYVRFQLELYYKTEDWAILSTDAPESICSNVEYTNEQLNICTEGLGIPRAAVLGATLSPKLRQHVEFLHKIFLEETWFR